jgi:hypothetical protein
MPLHALAGWGQVTARICYTAADGQRKLATISFRPHRLENQEPAPPGTSGLEIIFQAINYLEKRGHPYARASA